MIRKAFVATLAICTLIAGGTPPAYAIGLGSLSRSNPDNGGFSTRAAPLAYQLFCLRDRKECKKSNGPSTVANSPALFKLLRSVNRAVNRSIIPTREVGDTWSLNPRYGDCEDYALTKRSRLIHAGVPSGALRIAVVRTSSGEGHAVLMVRTLSGEFVLDNLRKDIVAKSQMGYRLVMEASADPTRFTRF